MKANDFLKTVEKKKAREKVIDRENDAMQIHRDFCVITKCEDSIRNTDTVLNKSKLSYIDRKEHRIKSVYDGLLIEKKGVEFKLKDITMAKVKHKGFILKARAINSHYDSFSFEISEKGIKAEISKGRIKIVKGNKND